MFDDSDKKESNVITITNCVNETDLSMGGGPLGGLIGTVGLDFSSQITIDNCDNKGRITSSDGGYPAAGLVGYCLSSYYRENEMPHLTVSGCTNSGEITSTEYAGGIVGQTAMDYCEWSIIDCTNAGNISADYAGGIIAQTGPSRYEYVISDCRNEGAIHTENGFAGGILANYFYFSFSLKGENAQDLYIRRCVNIGEISNDGGISGIGGIVGASMGLSQQMTILIDSCLNEGDIKGGTVTRAGGILGCSAFDTTTDNYLAARISNCGNTGNVTQGDGAQMVTQEHQGLPELTDEMLEYTDSTDEAMLIAGGSSIGGVVGYSQGVLIVNCASSGEVSIDSKYIPLLTYEDALTYYTALKLKMLDDETGYVFCGGICGVYYTFGGNLVSDQIGIVDSIYAGTILNAYCILTDDAGESVINVRQVDKQTATEKAESILSN